MKAVLDASCALAIALHKDETGPIHHTIEDADQVLAPDLLVPEFVNGLWKSYQFNEMNSEVCDRALDFLIQIVDLFVPSVQLYREAFALSRAHKSKAAYDMFYLALAQREDAVLVTRDRTLLAEAKRLGVRTA
jgi:predicted nucleic acid-binding protein